MSENEQVYSLNETQKRKIEVAVLGSARLTEDDEPWQQAYNLGKLLACAGFATITGGYGGLMAAVSQGAHSEGGHVIGLPMRHWKELAPNRWNTTLRWSTDYGTRLNSIQQSDAVIALPGGIGTLSELALTWAARQTEARVVPLILLGECWPPFVNAIRANLVVDDTDLRLLHFASSPEEAIKAIQHGLESVEQMGPGPRG